MTQNAETTTPRLVGLRELERCMNELGMAGIEIGSHINAEGNYMNLDHPQIFEVFEAAAELGAAVFVHPWDMMGRDRMGKYCLPWLVGMPAETALAICSLLFGGVIERLPRLRLCFAHGGGAFPGTFGRIDHGFRERPDLCAVNSTQSPRDALGRFYLDSLNRVRFEVNGGLPNIGPVVNDGAWHHVHFSYGGVSFP